LAIHSIAKLKLSFEAKGLQPHVYEKPSTVAFSAQTIVLERSPRDGSYGKYTVKSDNDVNTDIITFKNSGLRASDENIDDWEFTSVPIK